jgi:rhodanese-related sulfurtransferase
VVELKEMMDSGKDFILLDVRKPREIATAAIQPHLAIPMHMIPLKLAEIDAEKEVVVICHTGVRSAQVCHFLHGQGYEHLLNVFGGIDAWSRQIDDSVPLY